MTRQSAAPGKVPKDWEETHRTIFGRRWPCDVVKADWDDTPGQLWRAAVAAERARCAQKVRSMMHEKHQHHTPDRDDWECPYCEFAAECADAIEQAGEEK